MGRRRHPKYEYARWLFFNQTEDVSAIARLTGIEAHTIEKWRAAEKWIEAKAKRHVTESDEPVETLDDVTRIFTSILMGKARELKDTPINEIDTSVMDGLHKFVKSIREMSESLTLLTQKQLLLTAMDEIDFASAEFERGKITQETMLAFHDLLSSYCDSKLGS